MVDVNTPVTNLELVEAMEALQRQDTPETRADFWQALQTAHFLSPVTIEPRPESGQGGQTTLREQTRISFPGLTDAEGNQYLPVYTDWPALKQWRDLPDEQTLITTYADLSAMVLRDANSSGFVINPHSHNLPVRRTLLEQAAGHAVPWTVEKETRVHIGQPADDPVVLKEAVSRHLKTQKQVKAAWLVLMEKEGEHSFLLAVDFTGDRRATFDAIAAVAVPRLRQGELLDMVPADSGIGQDIVRDYPPFYQRKRIFGLF